MVKELPGLLDHSVVTALILVTIYITNTLIAIYFEYNWNALVYILIIVLLGLKLCKIGCANPVFNNADRRMAV